VPSALQRHRSHAADRRGERHRTDDEREARAVVERHVRHIDRRQGLMRTLAGGGDARRDAVRQPRRHVGAAEHQAADGGRELHAVVKVLAARDLAALARIAQALG
jgi:hypothetical protein